MYVPVSVLEIESPRLAHDCINSLAKCSLSTLSQVVLVRQTDKPGIIAGVSSALAQFQVNISYMTVAVAANGEAIMAIGVDSLPSNANEVLSKVAAVDGVQEATAFSEA